MDKLEYKSSQSKEPPRPRGGSVRTLHEFTFSLNVASAFGYALLLYASRNQSSWTPINDSTYYFIRSAFRINDLLHLPSANSVSTSAVARAYPSQWSQVGEEFLILVTVFGVAALVLFLLRLIAGTSSYRMILSRIAGLTALIGTSACYLYVSKLTWKWAPQPSSARHYSFWHSALPIVFAAEILCLGGLFAIHRKRPIPTWAIRTFLLIHYAFWVLALWPEIRFSLYPLYAPYLLVLVLPLSGIVWLRYLGSLESRTVETSHLGGVGKWTIATAIVASALLLYLWLPSKGYDFTHPKDMNSFTIQTARGPCFGSCPSYTITIHGNGLVEYVGISYVKVQGPQTSTVTPDQVIELLQNLHRAQLSSLEDRAFAWCFDAGSVSVSVSADGKTKRVVSDDSCTGSKSGLQAQFVKTAAEIDTIVGSDKWVSCDRPCRK